ncbi:MAG: hypothetical protein KBC81_01155 [Candidatus Pacebacteria bacterium]|nr:hypothetical protein [Candidatus Paceibacterota bacterium]
MALNMDFEEVASTIVEAMLPRGSGEKKVLVMAFDVRVSRRGSSARSHQKIAHLLFHRPQNYTKVGWNITDAVNARFDHLDSWEVMSNHDSCWRNDGISSPMLALVRQMMTEAKVKRDEADISIRFDLGQNPKVVELNHVIYDRPGRRLMVEYQPESAETAS